MKRQRGGDDVPEEKRRQFQVSLRALNQGFAEWVRVQSATGASLVCGVQDYKDYVAALRSRYLRVSGQVLTFGSGDCGQLAHGIEEDLDLMVKSPRKILSLADKQVVGISCGGLHNAVCTASGAVYTWGCNDDGSLGRPTGDGAGRGVEHFATQVTGGGLENEIIISVACGDGQTLCLSVAGAVFG